MFSVPAFLDRAKAGAGVDSDYALAKLLGVNRANVSGWRNETFAPDVPAIIKLCELSGDDPDHVAACIQSMRAANDDAAGLWRRVAERLKAGGQDVIAGLAVAMVFGALSAERAEAAPLYSAIDAAGLCIMSNSRTTGT